MIEKKTIYIDMDGVLCDFYNAQQAELKRNPKQPYPQGKWGFFLTLKPLKDAIESFKLLEEHFDVCILTRPSHYNVNCYTEKAQWIWDNFGLDTLENAIFSCDKSRLKGHYLIDDMDNAKQREFEGEWIHFGTEKHPDWKSVIEYIFKKEFGA